MEEKGNVDGIIKALQSKKPDVKTDAIQALGRLGSPRAVEPLFSIFQSLLTDKSSQSRAQQLELATSLAKLGDSRVLDFLTSFLGYKPGDEKGRQAQQQAFSAIRELGAKTFDYFKDKTDYTALLCLGLSGDPRAFDILLLEIKNMTEKGYPMRRRAAAFGLGWLGDNRAVEPLIEALTDQDGEVRVRVATSLGRLGDKRAVIPLLVALAFGGSYQGHFDTAALDALASIRDPRTANIIGIGYYDKGYHDTIKEKLQEIQDTEVEHELSRYGKKSEDLISVRQKYGGKS